MIYLQEHLKKYPLMQIEDIIKLHFQGLLGPAHLIKDRQKVENNLKKELEEANSINYNYELYELISDDYIRVYIKPFYEKHKSFNLLIDCFIESCNPNINYEEYVKEIQKIINNDNKDFIQQYLNSNNYLISHSVVYKKNYHPHYLVIKKEFISKL